jgi:hypothetical protein
VTDRTLVIPRKKHRIRSLTENMKTPYGLEVVENCLTYPPPKDRFFCNLPQAARAELDAISSSATYRKGEILFAEGQASRGVFVICKGRLKLSASSADGKSLILRIADPGPADLVETCKDISYVPNHHEEKTKHLANIWSGANRVAKQQTGADSHHETHRCAGGRLSTRPVGCWQRFDASAWSLTQPAVRGLRFRPGIPSDCAEGYTTMFEWRLREKNR